MNKSAAQKVLKNFQCDYNRDKEESFAQTFSENANVRVFFVNENQTFTDGRNIVVDPSIFGLYCDTKALSDTEDYLGWQRAVSLDPWYALYVITRAQTIHECLHILYTDFPPHVVTDLRCDTKNKKRTMALISNIIEDAYIEAVGCTVYDNIEMYLCFNRIAQLFLSHQSDECIDEKPAAGKPIEKYLNYMIEFLLYPMAVQDAPDATIAKYVEVTKELFLEGSKKPSPLERYEISQQIFDIVLPIIPPDSVNLDLQSALGMLGGNKTHDTVFTTLGAGEHKGKTQEVKQGLFRDENGNPRTPNTCKEKLEAAVNGFAKDKEAAMQELSREGFVNPFTGRDFDCAIMHKNIKINENHPKINPNLRKAYQNIHNRYRINIDSYNGRFLNLLKARTTVREEKQLFGANITSKHLGDVKKRYWYKNTLGIEIPDLAILLLIDGSGSMRGERREAAMISSVILHEVLQKQGMTHAIAEHRADDCKPEMDVNILFDFNGRKEERLNLLQIDAYGDNRDALALFWAERYLNLCTTAERKLIIIISDGYPEHSFDGYYPPVSVKDTANAVTKIQKRGTAIVAVSLNNGDESNSCYDMLTEIYPSLVDCTDLKRLTPQLLSVVSRSLE